MATCFDVASYIIEKLGSLPAMKLQKLVYYSQAWALVWDDEPLFKEPIQAWINGPIVPELYRVHRGLFKISHLKIGDSSNLSYNQKDTINHILDYYGDKNSQWLSDLTHLEIPWQEARKGLSSYKRGHKEITHASMAEYYSSISSIEELNEQEKA